MSGDNNNIVDFQMKEDNNDILIIPKEIVEADLSESQTQENNAIRALDGWNTNVQSVVIQKTVGGDDSSTYKLKKYNKVFIPYTDNTETIIKYYFDTLLGVKVEYDLIIKFAEDETCKPCVIKWIGGQDGDAVTTNLLYINWKDVLQNGGSVDGITNKKHVLSFNAYTDDSETEVNELVEIYIDVAISAVNSLCCSIDVNLYAKLTPYGEAFLNQDTGNQ